MIKQSNFLGSLMRGVRRIAGAFREKPEVTLEDYVFEHFMLYHGLVGSRDENQPQFKDVRRDVLEAILHKSSVEMAIALKLPPLWWEEKLSAIIGEAHQYHEETLMCLLPPRDEYADTAPDADPLRHSDWRVRSNAAKILAAMNAEQAIPQLVTALEEANDEPFKASFCHIIYALARIQNPQSRIAITKHLKNSDPWFRVDAVGALSKWTLAEAGADIADALLHPHSLNDYAAVAVSRNYKPVDLLNLADDRAEAGLEVVIGLVDAARGPFINDPAFLPLLEESFDHVLRMVKEKPTPRRLRALLEASSFIAEQTDDEQLRQQAELARAEYSDKAFAADILKWFQKDHADADPEFRHALKLVGYYGIKEAEPFVAAHLSPDSELLNEAVEALGTVGGAQAAPQLVALINLAVDVEERTSKPISKQPVFEEQPKQAKTYWLALKALGNLPYPESADLLLRAVRDFAPDKRQQAYSALVQIAQDKSFSADRRAEFVDVIRQGLSDPAAAVRVAALAGVEKLSIVDLIPEAVRLTASKENSVVRQARRTLAHLAQDGQSDLVVQSLKSAIDSERDVFRRQRLSVLLDDISQRRG